MAMRSAVMLGTSSSSFSGRSIAARSSSAASAAAPRAVVVSVEASGSTRQCKKCDLTGRQVDGPCWQQRGFVGQDAATCRGPGGGGRTAAARGVQLEVTGAPTHSRLHASCLSAAALQAGLGTARQQQLPAGLGLATAGVAVYAQPAHACCLIQARLL